jgi:hypothetical protein
MQESRRELIEVVIVLSNLNFQDMLIQSFKLYSTILHADNKAENDVKLDEIKTLLNLKSFEECEYNMRTIHNAIITHQLIYQKSVSSNVMVERLFHDIKQDRVAKTFTVFLIFDLVITAVLCNEEGESKSVQG